MRTYPVSCVVFCLVTSLLCAARPAGAQSTNIANFSGPVQLPGVVLPAGSYTFAVTRDGRSVVVSDAERHVVTTQPVVPITRAAGGDIIVMRAAVGTAAPEISALYTNRGTTGVEFLYRRERK